MGVHLGRMQIFLSDYWSRWHCDICDMDAIGMVVLRLVAYKMGLMGVSLFV